MLTPKESSSACKDRFATTHWSLVVLAAGRQDGREDVRSSEAHRAMAELCRSYWYPLYAYTRRCGHEAHDAEDLTQEFFLQLLDKDFLTNIDRNRGKFRSFLLASLKHFLANQWDRSHATKRGGHASFVPLDALQAETRYRLEPACNLTPEKLYERQWAITVLEQVLARLQSEFESEGKRQIFDRLKDFLTVGRNAGGHAQAATELGMTPGAVKVAVHRMRRRYRAILREEIAQTVATEDEINDEIRYLLSCL